MAPGERSATADEATAQVLTARRVEQLEALRRGRTLQGITRVSTLQLFARDHLVAKAKAGNTTTRWLASSEQHLRRACEFFGAHRDLTTMGVADVREWATWLATLPGRGALMSGGTVRHHLNTLSNLYRRAQAERYVIPGYNPVASLMEKPSARRVEAKWLEVHEAALFLEAARTHKPTREDLASPFAFPLVATFLLTGGRRAEVLGLEVEDVSFDRRTVTFRPNAWRRLKSSTSHRVVPMWTQLEEILRAYVFGASGPPGRLLFPSLATGGEAMLTDFRKLMGRISVRAGWKPAGITSRIFRHTYCAARLQTVDRGAPVSEWTVGRELGHGGHALVRRVYGHLGTVRHRTEVVEYPLETYRSILKERLDSMGL
ncbi:MAG: tyrosine-type recombinase/integrase [Gemmatimonadales bacterium]